MEPPRSALQEPVTLLFANVSNSLYGRFFNLQRILLDNLKQGATFGADELAVEVHFV